MPGSRKKKADVKALVGMKLRQMRLIKDWAQQDAAALARISPGYLSLIERGLKMPSVKIIIHLANIYGQSPVPVLRLIGPVVEEPAVTMPPESFDWRAPGWVYRNALNDPTFRHVHPLERMGTEVSESAKAAIAEVYNGIWDLQLMPDQVDRLYDEATHDPLFPAAQRLRSQPEQPFEVKRAIAELFLKHRQLSKVAVQIVEDPSVAVSTKKRTK